MGTARIAGRSEGAAGTRLMFGVQQGKAVDQAPRLRSRAPLRCVDDCAPTLTVLAHAGDVTPTRVARPREGSVRPKAKGRSDRKDSRPLYGLPRQQTSGLLLPMERVAQRSGEEGDVAVLSRAGRPGARRGCGRLGPFAPDARVGLVL